MENEKAESAEPARPAKLKARGREVNRRIAGSDLQRIVLQIRLIRRIYGVGALSTMILAGLLVASIGKPGIDFMGVLPTALLLLGLASVQALGALRLPRFPLAWAQGLVALQTIFYFLEFGRGTNSITQLIWLVAFWCTLKPMSRAQRFKSKHPDLYAAQLLDSKQRPDSAK
jgi:hypothetical protein